MRSVESQVLSRSALPRSYVFFIGSLILIGLLAVLLLAFYRVALTGNAGANLDIPLPVAGRVLQGTVSFDLSSGSLPLDSTLLISFNSYTRSLPLSALLPSTTTTYAHTVSYAPPVIVTVAILKGSSRNAPTQKSAEGLGTVPVGNGGQSISGGVIASPEETRTYVVRASSPLVDSLPLNTYASVRDVSVHGSSIGSSSVDVRQSGTQLTISTDYREQVRGFSLDDGPTLTFPLDTFNIAVPRRTRLATIGAYFVYGGDTFASTEQVMTVNPETNITVNNSPQQDSSLIPTSEPSLIPHDGSLSDSSASDTPGCERPLCTSFGRCAIRSLGPGFISLSAGGSLVRVRECSCENGRTYSEYDSCSLSTDDIRVVPSLDTGVPVIPSSPQGDLVDDSFGSSGGSRSVQTRWDATYTFDDRALSIHSSLTQSLAEHERVIFSIGGADHELGVVSLDTSRTLPRVLLQIKSTPRSFYLSLGEQRSLDITGDGLTDVEVAFSSVRANHALINIRPVDVSLFSQEAGTGEKAVTLVKESTGLPVARVILNENLPSLRVFLVQSDNQLPSSCYNAVQDGSETDIDCGGTCRACVVESRHYASLIAWLVVGGLFLVLLGVSRARSY